MKSKVWPDFLTRPFKLNYHVIMKNWKKYASMLSVLAVSACASLEEGNVLPDPALEGRPMTKVAKFNDEYDESTLLVKFQSVPSEDVLVGITSEKDVTIEKLFTTTPGKEALEARFGLDRWYVISGCDIAGVDAVAKAVASVDEVALVQYNHLSQKNADSKVYGFGDLTKAPASGLSFNDPLLVDQWHYHNAGNASIATSVKKGADINVKDVWSQLTCGDPSIVVAVVDEGVKYTHPDLADNMWTNPDEVAGNGIDDDNNGYIDDVHGYNFVDNGAITWDKVDANGDGDSGHGTHCAGTIAAVNNNGKGVSGVAGGSGRGDGCKIMSCQIFSGFGGGDVRSTVNAIKYAADNGASIISCSFGYTSAFASDNAYIKSQGSAEIDAIHYFEAVEGNNDVLNGNIAIFAAGNDAHPYAHYPGAFHDIISVTAFGPDYLPASYTNFGPGCNICAPGGESKLPPWNSYRAYVLSTVPSEVPELYDQSRPQKGFDYGYMQGTSMACPHVSGVVALALSYAKKLGKTFDKEEFKSLIVSSANDLDTKLTGEKKYFDGSTLNLAQYYHKLGTGAIDAWRLMMAIEGTPCLNASIGKRQWLDLSPYFGTASTSLTYVGVEVDEASREALGLAEEPYIEHGRLYIHTTKMGSGKVVVKAVGGGTELGGGDNVGGMELVREVSIISRSIKSSNQGWL